MFIAESATIKTFVLFAALYGTLLSQASNSLVSISGEGQNIEATIAESAIPNIEKLKTYDEVTKALFPVSSFHFDWETRVPIPADLPQDLKDVVEESRKFNDDWVRLRAEHEPVLRHQFTVLKDNKTLRCYSGSLFGGASYYFVFEDDQLLKVIKSPPWRGKVVWDERLKAKVEIPLPVDPDQRVKEVTAAPGLTQLTFVQSVKETAEGNIEAVLRYTEFNPVLIGLLKVEADKFAEILETRRRDYLKRVELEQQLDARKIAAGMRAEEVTSRLGDPIATRVVETTVIHVYGVKQPAKQSEPMPKLAVRFADDKVTAIFTGSFFDDRWLRTDAEPAKQSPGS